jgi:hypothetical protein
MTIRSGRNAAFQDYRPSRRGLSEPALMSSTPAIISYLYGTGDTSSTLFAPRCGIGQKMSSSENEGADPGGCQIKSVDGEGTPVGRPRGLAYRARSSLG